MAGYKGSGANKAVTVDYVREMSGFKSYLGDKVIYGINSMIEKISHVDKKVKLFDK